ncbi:MAG TPA: hypothetical protein VHA77_13095 [Xanthobacteraceae bacterium]|jgi:hypothetical protein|nr:hypothetical protein [Xanthobacteraceae bacterium]
MNNAVTVASPPDLPPVSDPREATELMTRLSDVMDELLALVSEETKLVRAGQLKDAAALERRKAELSRTYVADSGRLKASTAYLSASFPEFVGLLRQRHETFHALLQVNLAVLATAHAVSEGIMRGVSTEIARKASPQTYGASGRQTLPGPRGAQPLTVSRVL